MIRTTTSTAPAVRASSSAAAKPSVSEQIDSAIKDHGWVKFEYDGKENVVIPRKLDAGRHGQLLKGVRADNSEFRTYSLDKIASAEVLTAPQTRAGDVIGTLQKAIDSNGKVEIEYQLPTKSNPVSIAIDPEAFVWQPDHSLALNATKLEPGNPERHFRLDRILSVHDYAPKQ